MSENHDNRDGAREPSPAKPKRKRRRYTDEEKAAAIVMRRQNSNLESPVMATANALNIPHSNIVLWSQGRGVSEAAWKKVTEESKTLADIFRDVAVLAAGEMRERLSDPDSRAMLAGADLVRMAGVAAEKAQLLSGEPTAIVETRDDSLDAELRERAEARLAELLPHTGGDRDAAIALLRDHAPALSEYIN